MRASEEKERKTFEGKGKRESEGWGIRALEEKERKTFEGKGKRESEGWE